MKKVDTPAQRSKPLVKQLSPKNPNRRLSSLNKNAIQQPENERNLKFCWKENEKEIGTPPYERAGHSAIITPEKKLIIYGGHDASNSKLNDLVIFEFQLKLFVNAVAMNRLVRIHKGKLDFLDNCATKVPISPGQELTPPPPPRAYHTAVLKGDFMLVFGGCPSEIEGPLYFLHIPTSTWLKYVNPNSPTEVKTPRSHHTAVMHGDDMIIYGGINGVIPLGSLLSFSTTKFKWTVVSNKLPAIYKHSAFIRKDVLYIVGGQSDNGNNNFLAIDFKNGAVIEKCDIFPNIELNLRLLASAYDSSRDRLYIFGGFCVEQDGSESGCTDKLYIIDLKNKKFGYIFSPLMKCPSPRCGHTMVLDGNNLVVFGGCDRLPLLNGEWVFCDFSNTINIFIPPGPDVDLSRLRELIQAGSP